MNNYAKGANRERERVKWHLDNGATTAHRSAGSHSPIDVTAVYADCVVLESLKAGSARLTGEEAEALIELRLGSPPSVVINYVIWPDREAPRVIPVTINGFDPNGPTGPKSGGVYPETPRTRSGV